jgi:hypothetical protein
MPGSKKPAYAGMEYTLIRRDFCWNCVFTQKFQLKLGADKFFM